MGPNAPSLWCPKQCVCRSEKKSCVSSQVSLNTSLSVCFQSLALLSGAVRPYVTLALAVRSHVTRALAVPNQVTLAVAVPNVLPEALKSRMLYLSRELNPTSTLHRKLKQYIAHGTKTVHCT